MEFLKGRQAAQRWMEQLSCLLRQGSVLRRWMLGVLASGGAAARVIAVWKGRELGDCPWTLGQTKEACWPRRLGKKAAAVHASEVAAEL